MADQPTKIREVAWTELFPWLLLLRSVRIAMLARVMVLGAAGLLATMLGWWLLSEAFSRSTDPVIAQWRHDTDLGIWDDSLRSGVPNPWVNTTARSANAIFESAADSSLLRAPIAIWLFMTRPFIQMFQADLTAVGFLFLLLCGIWELIVWGFFGGAITRIAALKFTRDEAPGITAAVRHSLAKLPSYSLPLLIALAGTSLFAIQLVVVGILMHIDILALITAVFWPFVIMLGLMMAVLLLGALFGWPLMWATVSVEGTDAFDALSRSYAYTYQRPLRLLWYVLFAGFLAVVSMFVVKLFASSAIALGNWSIAWSLDEPTLHSVVAPRLRPEPPAAPLAPPSITIQNGEADTKAPAVSPTSPTSPVDESRVLSAAADIIRFWKQVVALLVAGFQAGFLWVSAVGIYLLLRRDVDGVPMSEVFIDQSEEYGLPPLVDDPATGVPEVAPHAPAIPGDTRI